MMQEEKTYEQLVDDMKKRGMKKDLIDRAKESAKERKKLVQRNEELRNTGGVRLSQKDESELRRNLSRINRLEEDIEDLSKGMDKTRHDEGDEIAREIAMVYTTQKKEGKSLIGKIKNIVKLKKDGDVVDDIIRATKQVLDGEDAISVVDTMSNVKTKNVDKTKRYGVIGLPKDLSTSSIASTSSTVSVDSTKSSSSTKTSASDETIGRTR